jgi:hypothetical protein
MLSRVAWLLSWSFGVSSRKHGQGTLRAGLAAVLRVEVAG